MAVLESEPLKPPEEDCDILDVEDPEPLEPEDEESLDTDDVDDGLLPEPLKPLEPLELPDDDLELLELRGLVEAVTTSVPPTKTSKAESTETFLLSIVTAGAPGTSVVLSMTILVGFTVKMSLPMTMVSSGCAAAWALLLPTRSSNKRRISEEMKKCW